MLLRVRVVLSSGSVARLVQLELCRQISTGRLTANSVPDALGKVSAHGTNDTSGYRDGEVGSSHLASCVG
jgi:hypothetical protein